jgi:hypothetical protein
VSAVLWTLPAGPGVVSEVVDVVGVRACLCRREKCEVLVKNDGEHDPLDPLHSLGPMLANNTHGAHHDKSQLSCA